ncbi:unnamed protein product [Toxocara canis]|uniref:DUF1768 domain-containing protein n=1 Tax=Toxocara canis TaxID=6265 RepID=A0A183UYI8_TOXCA|nr:unnamed protein product [Toxocara canis]
MPAQHRPPIYITAKPQHHKDGVTKASCQRHTVSVSTSTPRAVHVLHVCVLCAWYVYYALRLTHGVRFAVVCGIVQCGVRSLNGERTVQYLDWDELRRSRDKRQLLILAQKGQYDRTVTLHSLAQFYPNANVVVPSVRRSFLGYGDFTGLGNFNSFEGSVEQTHIAMDEGATPQPLSGNGRRQGSSTFNLQQEMMWIKQDSAQIRNAVMLLEKEKDNLRQAVRKLKLENARVKQKLKRMQEAINGLTGQSTDADNIKVGAAEVDLDYDDIGRDFILVGGTQDPLSLRFEVAIRDERGTEHKSAERYYWYKMAEHFGDTETMAKILDAPTTIKAEEAMKEIKDFDEAKWNEIKMSVWEAGQRLKLEQTRWISNLLVYTGKTYIAVASQDKVFGTGWRKNRDEANKPIFWDGENQGGKALMRLRQQIKETHSWSGPYEEQVGAETDAMSGRGELAFQEIEKRYNDLKKYVWRRIDPARRLGILRGRGRGFGRRGGYGGRGYGTPSAFAQSVRH